MEAIKFNRLLNSGSNIFVHHKDLIIFFTIIKEYITGLKGH